MKLLFHRDFERSYASLRPAEKEKCDGRLMAFGANPFDSMLNNHPLRGTYAGYRSINIAGDLRAIYREIDSEAYFFVALGPHKKLYRSCRTCLKNRGRRILETGSSIIRPTEIQCPHQSFPRNQGRVPLLPNNMPQPSPRKMHPFREEAF